MLYLAEVKKQTKGFIGGYKTELKLLACQHKDQTWSAIPGEDILTYDETNSHKGRNVSALWSPNT